LSTPEEADLVLARRIVLNNILFLLFGFVLYYFLLRYLSFLKGSLNRRTRERPPPGFTLFATLGPEEGRSWLLDQPVITINGGSASQRPISSILMISLSDRDFEPDGIKLIWDQRYKTFAIRPAKHSVKPIVVSRRQTTGTDRFFLSSTTPELLLVNDDLIHAGRTVLRFLCSTTTAEKDG
jgi:hypothetical protein